MSGLITNKYQVWATPENKNPKLLSTHSTINSAVEYAESYKKAPVTITKVVTYTKTIKDGDDGPNLDVLRGGYGGSTPIMPPYTSWEGPKREVMLC